MSKTSQLSSSTTPGLQLEVEGSPYTSSRVPADLIEGGYKKFIVASTFAHWLTNLNLLWGPLYYILDQKGFEGYFVGFNSLFIGYDIFCAITIVVGLAALSLPQVGKQKFAPGIFILFWACHLYLSLFLVRYQVKALSEWRRTMLLTYIFLLASSTGSFIAALVASSTSRKVSTGTSMGVAAGIAFGLCKIMEYSPKIAFRLFLHEMVIFLAAVCFFAGFFAADLTSMITRRADLYRPGDWAHGAAHLFTDIFGNFWYQNFVSERKPAATIDITAELAADHTAASLDL